MNNKLLIFIFAMIFLIQNVYSLEIRGIVLEASTEMDILRNTRVEIVETGQVVYTDNDASFIFENLESGTYTIRVTYLVWPSREKTISLTGNSKGLVIYLSSETMSIIGMDVVEIIEHGYSHLKGKITDQNGNDVEDASLRITMGPFSNSERFPTRGFLFAKTTHPPLCNIFIKTGYIVSDEVTSINTKGARTFSMAADILLLYPLGNLARLVLVNPCGLNTPC